MKLIQGDSQTQLKTLKSESINCCVTSPPYWALRDYGTEGQIWDETEECNHEWSLETKKNPMDRGGKGQHDSNGMVGKMGEKTQTEFISGFCSKCNAWKGSLGLEPTFDLYIKHLCDIYDEVKRVLRKDGTCWVNLGDTYLAQQESIPSKCLTQIPFRFSIEMCNRGWILRNVIIWHKPNCMPSSAKDRFTVDFEYLFFFVKNKKYWFEQQKEKTLTKDNLVRDRDTTRLNNTPGRNRMGGLKVNNYDYKNKRTVWKIPTKPFKDAHFAVFPEGLIETPIKSGCPKGGIVLDPFMGSGTTGVVAQKLERDFIGIELNPEYIEIAKKRLDKNKTIWT